MLLDERVLTRELTEVLSDVDIDELVAELDSGTFTFDKAAGFRTGARRINEALTSTLRRVSRRALKDSPVVDATIAARIGELVTDLSEQDRTIVANAVTRATVKGLDPESTARSIKRVVGLDARYSDAVQRMFYSQLDSGYDAVTAHRISDQYADRLRLVRARRIARTEIARARNASRLQAMFRVDPTARKIWVLAGTACKFCQSLAEQGAIGLGEAFVGGILHPPAHPNCMCVVERVTRTATTETRSAGTGAAASDVVRMAVHDRFGVNPSRYLDTPLFSEYEWVDLMEAEGFSAGVVREAWEALGVELRTVANKNWFARRLMKNDELGEVLRLNAKLENEAMMRAIEMNPKLARLHAYSRPNETGRKMIDSGWRTHAFRAAESANVNESLVEMVTVPDFLDKNGMLLLRGLVRGHDDGIAFVSRDAIPGGFTGKPKPTGSLFDGWDTDDFDPELIAFVRSESAVTNVTEARVIGRTLKKEVDRRLKLVAGNEHEEIADLTQRMNRLKEEIAAMPYEHWEEQARTAWVEINRMGIERDKLLKRLVSFRQEALLVVMNDVREMGTVSDEVFKATFTVSSTLKPKLQLAQIFVPRDWLSRFMGTNKIKVTIDDSIDALGDWSSWTNTVRINLRNLTDRWTNKSGRAVQQTILHELMHVVEDKLHSGDYFNRTYLIKRLEEELWESRITSRVHTTSGGPVWFNLRPGERWHADDWPGDKYMGRQYEGVSGQRSHEILTRGMEGLFMDDFGVWDDDELLEFLLGVLGGI